MARLLTTIANVWLIAFAADAALSVADAGLAQVDVHALRSVRSVLALGVMLGSAPLLLLMAASAGLPWRLLAIPAIFPWALTLLLPIPVLVAFGHEPAPWLDGVLALLQLAVATGVFLSIRRREGRWLLTPHDDAPLGWRRALVRVVAVCAGLPFVIMVAFAAEIVVGVDVASHGFLRLTTRGVEIAQHDWIRDGQTVRLVGMVHVGDEAFYRELHDEMADAGAMVLEEGVSDPEGLLKGRLDYQKLAKKLGLSAQIPLRSRDGQGRARNADLTLSDFSPDTVAFIGAVGDLYSGQGDVSAAFATVQAAATGDRSKVIRADVYDKRNVHLLGEIDRALTEVDLVAVPWGAAHMPVLEDGLRARGFERGGWRTWVLATW